MNYGSYKLLIFTNRQKEIALKAARDLEKNNEREISGLNSKFQMISKTLETKKAQIDGIVIVFNIQIVFPESEMFVEVIIILKREKMRKRTMMRPKRAILLSLQLENSTKISFQNLNHRAVAQFALEVMIVLRRKRSLCKG
jgi:hypothetical protein